ncbi:MAG: hypothetical protein PHS20_05490 [Sphaerochaetaceae bacterium]|jgi:hypothetical protein|nr:hypothetical protein [Sphaerochaetaceae bacterium]
MERKLKHSSKHRIPAEAADYIALDNSSIIYPPTEAKFNSNVFRISAELKETVKPRVLESALCDVLDRLPYFRTRLREGFFWYYLASNPAKPHVFEDGPRPCARILNDRSLDGYLFRVSYFANRVAVDFFHALTDGGGGKTFLLSLLARYFELQGYVIDADPGIIQCRSKPQKWETEDLFHKLYRKLPFPDPIRGSYHLKGVLAENTHFISAELGLESLKAASHRFGCTINELFASVLVKVLLEREEKERRRSPVQISVPMGLRPIYKLDTLRNFSLFAVVSIDPRLGPYTLEEIIRTVHLQMQIQLDTKELDRMVSRNVTGERLVGAVPNFIKKPFFKILTDRLGDNQYTATLSNLGSIRIPAGMAALIERFDFFLAPNKKNILECAAAGFNDKVTFNFNSYLSSDVSVERGFFCALVQMGVPVKVCSNRGGDF